MSLFAKYVEARDSGTMDTPPQGKGSKSYFGPNTKNNMKAKIRVAEKPTNPLGDEASPTQKNPKDNLPGGEKPDYSKLGSAKAEHFVTYLQAMDEAKKKR